MHLVAMKSHVLQFFALFLAAGSACAMSQTQAPPQNASPAVAAHAGNASPDSAAIRREGLEDEMTISFLRSVHSTNLHDACKDALGTGIEMSTRAYGDLDGDGREEAAVTAFSCLAGNGGPDLIAVFTLTPNSKVEELPIEKRKWNEPFKGRDPSIGLRGQMTVAIENGRLIEKFPIFKETDPGCCASGGTREFIFGWKSDKLVLDDIVDLATSLPSTQASGPSRAIRAVNVKKLLDDNTFGLVPDTEIEELKGDCAGNGRLLLDVEALDYADLDGDGQEEAVYQGFTCMSGSAGMDFFGVVKLTAGGKLVDMPIAPHEGPFQGRDVYGGLRGHMGLAILNGKLAEVHPVYADERQCEACSSGGQRQFIFRWDGNQFVLDDVIDVPESTSR
jgi:hypothetical protein